MAQSTVPEGFFRPLTSSTSTRVFTLNAGEYNDPVTGTLTEYCLDHAAGPGSANYEAVSYVWGPPSSLTAEITSVTINSFTYGIRNNLHQGLRRLRRPARPRRLWVDALCISQTDLQEKARQVAQLGEIFQLAKKVLIWTGEHYDDSEFLFQKTSAHYQDLDGQLARMGSWPAQVLEIDCDARRWLNQWATSYVAFSQRPYWKRLWPIQEIGISTVLDVHCGESHQSWEALVRILWDDAIEDCSLIQDLWVEGYILQDWDELDIRDHFISLASFQKIAHYTNSEEAGFASSMDHFLDLFVQYGYAECDDRRDRVYALLSLLKTLHLDTHRITPDYTITIPELFVRVYETTFDAPFDDCGQTRRALSDRLDDLASAMRLRMDEHSEVLEILLERMKGVEGHLHAWLAWAVFNFFTSVVLLRDDLDSSDGASELQGRHREEHVIANLSRLRRDSEMVPYLWALPDEEDPWRFYKNLREEDFEEVESSFGAIEVDSNSTI